MKPAHDLRREVPWIPVLYLDGHRDTLALQPLLEQAHLIREVEAEAVEWAALMRFLPSVTALVARAAPRADFDGWASDGIPSTIITQALDGVSDRLWLRHPDTPFMQEPKLACTGTPNSTEWLHLTAPNATSKAWWGKVGDRQHPDAGTPARIARGLLASWYFSPGIGGKALGTYTDAADIGWRPRGTLGTRNHGLRIFHQGDNLAHTLLANTMENHIRGRANQPLWAAGANAAPGDGPLTASTWTGSVYLLGWDEHGGCIGVHVGGRRLREYSLGKDERTKQAAAAEVDVWRTDPTIPRTPVIRAGEETGEVRPVRALHPSANAVQWAAEWHAADSRRGAARAMEPGLVDADAVDVFTITVDGSATAPEIAHIARIGELSSVAAPGSRNRLQSLSALIVSPIRATLYGGLCLALGKENAKPQHDRLFASFCTIAEPILDDIIHAPSLERAHAITFTEAAETAFERFITPYLNSRTLAGDGDGIAVALAFVRARISKTLREAKL